MFLYQITVFLQQNTTASLLELYFNDPMQTVYACGGSGSQQREVADGADVVFTDSDLEATLISSTVHVCRRQHVSRGQRCRRLTSLV